MDQSQINTLNQINQVAKSAQQLLEARDEIKPKVARTFTRPEAVEYLKCDYRTIQKYCSELDIDPAKYSEHGIDFMIDLEEIYRLRDALPATTVLKKQFKTFTRSLTQKCQRVVVQNQKGGVGKTLSAVTIATGLSTEYHQHYRVLLVDLDGQSTASSFQPSLTGEERATIGELMMLDSAADDYAETIKNSVSDTTVPNMKILPASQGDRDVEAEFHTGIFEGNLNDPYKRLDAVLNALQDDFDIVIIDTPPSLGFASINAYYAASSVIIPLGANHNDTDATCQYLAYLPTIYKQLISLGHPGYDFMKMLITNYEESTSTLEVLAEINSYFGQMVFSTPFKKSEAIRSCALNKNSVFDLSTSTYVGTKATFKNAKVNALSVVGEVMREVASVWKKQEAAINE